MESGNLSSFTPFGPTGRMPVSRPSARRLREAPHPRFVFAACFRTAAGDCPVPQDGPIFGRAAVDDIGKSEVSP